MSRRGIGARSRLSAGRDAEEENEDEAEGSGWVRRANGAVACIWEHRSRNGREMGKMIISVSDMVSVRFLESTLRSV